MAFMKLNGASGVTGMTGTVVPASLRESMMESKRNPFEPFDTYEEWVANFSSQTFQVLEDCTYHKATPRKQSLKPSNLKDIPRVDMEADMDMEESVSEMVLLYPERTLVTGADLYHTFKDLDGFHPPILVLINGQRIRQLRVPSEKPLLIKEAPVSFNGREDDIVADMFLDILPTLPAEQLARLVARKDITQKISNIIRQFLA